MAYRRRQGISRASTFKEEIHYPPAEANHSSPSPVLSSSSSFPHSNSSSLAAQAIRASASDRQGSKGFGAYDDASTNDPKNGFWGVLARKAKAMLDDDLVSQNHDAQSKTNSHNSSPHDQFQQSNQSTENVRKMDNRSFRKGLDKITTSLNQLGDTFEKAFEEGRTIVENKTADIIQETRKLQIKRQGNNSEAQSQAPYNANNSLQQQSQMQPIQPRMLTNHETQLKASRDVAMATAAKAKLLLRELKTVKADLAFAKERCAQLEEENKILRENRDKGDHRADDDLIRLQLETLLAEKARLAHENSIYARENRFLREIVEYHQLTMQDVVYLDECTEEVTEVYPFTSGLSKLFSISPTSSVDPPSPTEDLQPLSPSETKEIITVNNQSQENQEVPGVDVKASSDISDPVEEDAKRPSSNPSA